MLPLALAVSLQQVADTPDRHRVFAGTLTHAGHGPVPGATTTHPFRAEVADTWARWGGDGWEDRLWKAGRDAWADEPWRRASDREVVQLLAARPAALARWVLAHPEEWTVVGPDVRWSVDGHLATWHFDDLDTGHLSWRRAHPVFGDVEEGVWWDDGAVRLAFVDDDTRWSATLSAVDEPIGAAPPAPVRVRSVPLSEGLTLLEVPEADSRVVLAVAGQEGVLLDTPLSSSLGAALRAEAERLAPQVTSWTVVVSHHHPHYTGGLRPWARAGATIVAPAAIRDWLTEALREPRDLDDDPPVQARVIGVTEDHPLLDGALVVRPVGEASGHTEAFVVSLWRPTGAIYVGDLARQPADSPPRHRGTWPEAVDDLGPTQVISGFPLDDAPTFPYADLVR